MTDELKTLDQYVADRRKLELLSPPAMRMTIGSDRDLEYRAEAKSNYALDMIGHLLKRIEELESR